MSNEIYQLADTVMMKKPHACQANQWEILRLGADIRLKCMGCGHLLMMKRVDFNKRLKKVMTKANDPKNTKLDHYLPEDKIARPPLLEK